VQDAPKYTESQRRARFRVAFREFPFRGRVCFYVACASFLLLPLTGLFGIFGSIITRSPLVPTIQIWVGSISAITCVISFTAVTFIERAQLRSRGERISPLRHACVAWFVFTLIIFVFWLILAFWQPEHRHQRTPRANSNAN
jgi:hypothetical protein